MSKKRMVLISFIIRSSFVLHLLAVCRDEVFFAEVNGEFTCELAEHCYSGVDDRVTFMRMEIIIRSR
ncbi:hypothetical protein ZOSMA_57G00550 [Zostera marina]|uniref:Secreted protein n=1 Tax=Zostera marina TaxID=29655 RepID=A0A0K9NVD2_ZOSMR|nr:hypothetical protein ZOSMA_57G00550 [Zostera marina]